jgi:signal transduction histidine kinase
MTKTIEELQEEVNRYKAYFDKSYGIIWCFDIKEPYSIDLPEERQLELYLKNGYFSKVNDAFLKSYGFESYEDVIGKGLYSVFPKNDPKTEKTFRQIIRSNYAFENLLTKEKDIFGNVVSYLNQLIPEIENGKLIRVWGTSIEITDRVLSEEFEHLVNKLITRFVDCALDEIDEKIRIGINEILDFLNFDWGVVYERNQSDEFLPVIETKIGVPGSKRKKIRLEIISNAGFPYLFDKVVTRGKVVNFSKIDELPEIAEKEKKFFKEEGISSAVFIPLITGGQCNAILSFKGILNEIELPEATDNRLLLVAEVFSRLIQRRNSELKLQEAYAQLEEKVNLRTQKLTDTLLSLKNTQAELIKSEKLAMLGQLVSGVAHEINNPLGAINASNENILHAYEKVKEEYPQLFQKLDLEMQQQFIALLNKLSSGNATKSSSDKRNLKKQILEKLESDHIKNAERVSETLLDLDLTTDIESYYDLFKHKEQALILNTLYHCGQILINSQNIKKAIDQTSKIVFALNAYNYNSKANKRIKTSIPETIENALILFQSKLKQDIEVVKKYDKVPNILCNPIEINQVWINIIQNALQAMNFKGNLEIEVKTALTSQLDGQKFDEPVQFIVSRFTDNGLGIPELELNQIFEPFYTTKSIGEGTGLGLDLSMKIVKDHGGDIVVESQPGKTAFEVWLPVEEIRSNR